MATHALEEALPAGALPFETRPWPVRAARGLLWFARRKPLGFLGLLIILTMLLFAAAAALDIPARYSQVRGGNVGFLYPYDYQVLRDRQQGVSLKHLMGTDNLGRDTFSRIVYGAKVSVFIGFSAVAISQALAAIVGTISGYYGGRFDVLFQRVVDTWQALPGLVALIFIVSVLGNNLVVITVAIGALGAAGASRIIRGAVISIKQNAYIEAARVVGATDLRILIFHILPNVFHLIIIGASIGIGGAILAESALAFLGFGLPPPYPSWGRMLNVAREFLTSNPMMAIWPGLALTVTVFAFNVLGDALRDVLDPRLRGSR
jgi:peptide/nickel transport system permease protein